ncbi:unnamed protein product [Lactuca virosa]|uniref:Uncharacterized protein n=1 Tax=Lactuca virosa TaxID=75947 RepID=A0AAU9LKF4_9ASTR|nr:unnamed protein product [Lactuca virosa]
MNEGICERTDGKKVEEKLMSSCSRWSNVEGKRIRDIVAGVDESQWSTIRGEPAVANKGWCVESAYEGTEEGRWQRKALKKMRRWRGVDDARGSTTRKEHKVVVGV